MQQQLEKLPKVEQVKFAIFCANKCKHLSEDKRVALAIQAAQNWVDDSTWVNEEKAKSAAYDANCAGTNAIDAHAAAAAAYAAYAATYASTSTIAAFASNAAYATAYAAAYAVSYLTAKSLFEEWTSEKLYKIMEEQDDSKQGTSASN